MSELSTLNDPKITATFVAITPEIAARWLQSNTRNRNLRQSDLDRYKRDMIAGRWHLDGMPIQFGTDGTLLNGQHRLTAIVETGVTVVILVVRGVAPEAQSVMDTGRRRTAADALAINGHKNTPMVAATALLHLSVCADKIDQKYEVSHEEILECIDGNPGITHACEVMKNYARRTDCPPSIVAYSYFILSQLDPTDAFEFWVSAAEKVGLAEGDPVIALTNRFAEARRNRERLPRRTYLSLIYRAWNARRAGKSMRFIRVNSPKGGLVPIPEPK